MRKITCDLCWAEITSETPGEQINKVGLTCPDHDDETTHHFDGCVSTRLECCLPCGTQTSDICPDCIVRAMLKTASIVELADEALTQVSDTAEDDPTGVYVTEAKALLTRLLNITAKFFKEQARREEKEDDEDTDSSSKEEPDAYTKTAP